MLGTRRTTYLLMNPLSKLPITDPVVAFFTCLGYTVSWDMNRSTGDEWYEILDGDYMVAQIDMGVPLAHIREDMTRWHEGKDGTSPSDYTVNMPQSAAADRLLERVARA